MIDPTNITNYERTDEELEEFLLFCVLVANKNSDRMAKALDFLLRQGEPDDSPLDTIRMMVLDGTLMTRLVQAKTGEYIRRHRTLAELTWVTLLPNLRTVKAEELEQIYGIGPKTARLFVMHTQRDAQCAALDVHILRHLRDVGFFDIPKSTPTNPKQYKRIEDLFLADAWCNGKTPAEHDLEIWTYYSGRAPEEERAA